MKMQSRQVIRAISVAVGSLGMYVLIGWATGSAAMVRVIPNSVAVTINAAIMLVISAALLSMPLRESRLSGGARGFVFALLTLAGASLFEHLSGIAIGIDLAHLHEAINDGNPAPGRVAPNASVAFLFVGLALIGLSNAQMRSTRLQGAAIAFCIYGTLAIGISGLIGYALDLEVMYRFAVYNSMAFPTALGLTLLGIDLWLLLRIRTEHRRVLPVAADKHITKTAIVVLTVVTSVTCLTGFLVLKRSFEEVMSAAALRNASSYASTLASAIDHQLVLDDIIAARPGLQNGLVQLENTPFDPKTVALLGQIGRSFTEFGLSGYQLFDAKGGLVVTVGLLVADQAVVNVPLAGHGEMATLMWQDGFVLHNTKTVWRDGRRVGHFIAEHRMTSLAAMLRSMALEAASTDVLVCARYREDALCFPGIIYKANAPVPLYGQDNTYPAISRALLGQRGVMTVHDRRGVQVLAAYAPVGTLGLGVVHKTDSIELYGPIRARLYLFIGMLVLLVAVGTFMLRAQVQPLARKLVSEKERMKVILDSSHDAFIEIDAAGIVVDWNAEAERVFGWSRPEVIGKLLAELIVPAQFHEKYREGMQRLLNAGHASVIGKRMELPALHRSGKELFVEVRISVIEECGQHSFTVFLHDISDRKTAELKLLESERQLAKLARFDTLTGLPNRFQLNEKLEETANRCRRLGKPLAVMFLDIDHFKQINDTLGHAAGDIVLKEFATRLSACLRTTDVAGRLAGDEFVVFIEAPHSIDEPSVIARKILNAMQGSWSVNGQSVQVSTSIGIAFASKEILSVDTLLAKADSALYKAKRAGRNQFIIEMLTGNS